MPAISLAGKGEGGFSALWRPALWMEKVPFLVMGVAVSGVALMAMPSSSVVAVGAGSLVERVQTGVVAYGFYLLKMLWPSGLSISYLHPGVFSMWELGAAAGGLVCVSVGVVWGGVRHPYLLMGWLWYVVTLFPVSGVFSIGAGFWMAADRYTYIPLVGPFVMIAWLVPEWVTGWRFSRLMLGGAAGVVVAVLMVLTWEQVGVWRSSGTLFEHAMRVRPDNWPAMRGMANFFEDNGRLDEAIPLWREALRLRPEDVVMRSRLVRALLVKGRTEEAVAEGREMLRLAPASSIAHFILGRALKAQGRLAQARDHYERALEVDPRFDEARYRLAILLVEQGRLEEAVSQYREVLRRGRGFAELHYNLGVALGLLGRAEEAISQYREALKDDPAYTGAWLNLGILLGRQGKIEEALSCYRKVLSIKPDFAEAHYLLGSAYAGQGNRDEALRHYRALLGLKPPLADALLRQIEARP